MFSENTLRQPSLHSPRMAATASAITHTLTAFVLLWLFAVPPAHSVVGQVPRSKHDLVWVVRPGLGSGGGGGGDKTRVVAPARAIGVERLTVPAAPPAVLNPVAQPHETLPPDPLTLPAKPLASSTDSHPGLLATASSTPTTQGPGIGGGAGEGRGKGAGEGDGSGAGPGSVAGIGGNRYAPGGGVSAPRLIRQVKPDYTVEAMRAKVQGVVLLECVILPDGNVGEMRIVKSLDHVFGLDEQALKAAKQWKFEPGRRFGEPVPVLVTIEVSFNLR